MKHKYKIKQLLILLCILKLYKKSNWLSSCTKTRTRKTAKLVLEKLSKVARSFVSIWWFHLISSHAWDNFRWSLNRSGLGFRASWVVWSSETVNDLGKDIVFNFIAWQHLISISWSDHFICFSFPTIFL